MYTARENYLATDVTTASPQKLHLMLIDAALGNAHRARQHWQAKEDDRATESLIRAQDILNELICALNRESEGDLVKKVAAVYLFIFRSLVDAGYRHDEQKLADAIRILEIERETWRQVCEKMAGNQGHSGRTVPPSRGMIFPPGSHDIEPAAVAGLSIEA